MDFPSMPWPELPFELGEGLRQGLSLRESPELASWMDVLEQRLDALRQTQPFITLRETRRERWGSCVKLNRTSVVPVSSVLAGFGPMWPMPAQLSDLACDVRTLEAFSERLDVVICDGDACRRDDARSGPVGLSAADIEQMSSMPLSGLEGFDSWFELKPHDDAHSTLPSLPFDMSKHPESRSDVATRLYERMDEDTKQAVVEQLKK